MYLWLNYHTVHHLFPRIDFSHHPAIQVPAGFVASSSSGGRADGGRDSLAQHQAARGRRRGEIQRVTSTRKRNPTLNPHRRRRRARRGVCVLLCVWKSKLDAPRRRAVLSLGVVPRTARSRRGPLVVPNRRPLRHPSQHRSPSLSARRARALARGDSIYRSIDRRSNCSSRRAPRRASSTRPASSASSGSRWSSRSAPHSRSGARSSSTAAAFECHRIAWGWRFVV